MRLLVLASFLVSMPAALVAQAWEAINSSNGSRCPAGSPWHFWIHRGQTDRLLVYLEGGGACWTQATCDLKGRPSFDANVDEQDDPATSDGILNLTQPANPFRGWSVVYIPYCTADVHLGARTVTYAPGITIEHRGAANVHEALTWIKAQLPSLNRIVVAGGSAGAIPTPVYAARLATLYPRATVTGVGDGAGGYRSPAIPGILVRWGVRDAFADLPAFAAIDSTKLTFEALYIAAGATNRKLRLAQINADRDEVQVVFLGLLGMTDPNLAALEKTDLDEIAARVPTFQRYTIASTEHTVLTRPSFYTTSAGGETLVRWVERLIH